MYAEWITDDPKLIPKQGSMHAVGYDAKAAKDFEIPAMSYKTVPLGVYVKMDKDMEIQVRSRSGLAASGVFVLNAPGTIDPDYTGEIKVILANFNPFDVKYKKYHRVCQLVFARRESVRVTVCSDCPEEKSGVLEISERGNKGFGSTGLN